MCIWIDDKEILPQTYCKATFLEAVKRGEQRLAIFVNIQIVLDVYWAYIWHWFIKWHAKALTHVTDLLQSDFPWSCQERRAETCRSFPRIRFSPGIPISGWKLRSHSQLCSFDKHKLGALLLLLVENKGSKSSLNCGFSLCWPNPNQLWLVFPHPAQLGSNALIGFRDFSSSSPKFYCHRILYLGYRIFQMDFWEWLSRFLSSLNMRIPFQRFCYWRCSATFAPLRL